MAISNKFKQVLRYPQLNSVLFGANPQNQSMLSSANFRFFHFTGVLSLSAITVFALLLPAQADNGSPTTPNSPPNLITPHQDGQRIDPATLRPLSQDSSLLSIPGGKRLINEATDAISAQNYELATKKFQEARQVFNQLSKFYQQLAGNFTGIDNRISDGLRQKALETAQMRDETTYQLALVHRAQNQPELAVPLLLQIIDSQNPTRDLGKKAYQQLFELGFVDSPYPRSVDGQSNPSSNTPTPQPSTTPTSPP